MFPWGNSTPFQYLTGQDQQINENPSSSCFSNFPSHLQICDDDDFLISTHFVKHRHKEHIPSLPPYHSPLPPVDGIVQAHDKTGARQPKSVDEDGSKDGNTKAPAPEARKSSEIPVKTRSSSTVKKQSSAGGGSTAKRRRTAASAATTTTTTRTRQPPGAPRRRIGKKDRHSKIFTAHGPRDRRMRLSLQIARKFFDLQDMLGFDKASKTIEWLFTMSKSAIEELPASMPQKSMGFAAAGGGRGASASSTTTTDCIVSMGMELESANIEVGPHHHGHVMWENKGTDHPNTSTRKKSSYSSSARRHPIMILDDLVKERREKARARARARTDEKRLKKERPEERNSRLELSSPDFTNPMNSCSEKLGSSSSTLETAGEESAGCPSQEFNSSIIMEADQCNSPQQFLLENQMASVDIIEKLVGTTTSSIYDPCQLLRDGVSSGIRYDVDDDFLDILTAGNWVSTTESTTSVSLGYGEMMTSLIMTGDVGRVQGQNPSSIFILQSD